MSVLETAEMPGQRPMGGRGLDDAPARAVEVLDELASSVAGAGSPTAQTSVGEMAVTALSVPPPEIVGVAWTLQDVPLKNSTSGAAVAVLPTAQTSLLDKAAHARERAAADRGAATADQLVPLKFSIRRTGASRCRRPRCRWAIPPRPRAGRPRDGRARHDLEAARRSWRDSS